MQAPIQKLAFLAGAVAYPSVVEWGTLWPADKQFQTALMMLFAGLLISQPKSPIRASVAIGIVGSLSVLFKALGVFLLPLALWYFYRRPRRELATAVLAALVTALPFMAFLQYLLHSTDDQQGAGRILNSHGRRPQFAVDILSGLLHVLSSSIDMCGIGSGDRDLSLERQIDLLNCMAALTLVFICLWTNGGSMDRLNIAMMFALLCTATISVRYWQTLTLFNYAIQVPVYAYYGLQHFRR